jgi:hypothetical protein
MTTAYTTIKEFEIMRLFKKDSLVSACMVTGLRSHVLMNNLGFAAEIYPENEVLY